MKLFDTHAHLQHPRFDDDREDALERARDAGVQKLLILATDHQDAPAVVELARSNPECLAAVGVHPCDIGSWSDEAEAALVTLAAEPEVVVWGEIGLDYFHKPFDRAEQRRIFRRQLAIARELGLPVSMHCRGEGCYEDLIADLRTERGAEIGGVAHCFAGTQEEAGQLLDMGLYLGVGGIATFPKSDDLRAILKACGPERLILETDSPFLAPQPARGRRNEPAYVAHVAEEMGRLFGMSAEDFAVIAWKNGHEAFRLVADGS